MQLKIYQIDAFASLPFEGNPAAVCPLHEWLPDNIMQSIAEENNLSETVFFVPTDKGFHIRWFTPVSEVDLCGHATLASAYVVFNELGYDKEEIVFESRSGPLVVKNKTDWLEMDFPSRPPEKCAIPVSLKNAFKNAPVECLKSEDYILVFDNEKTVLQAKPDLMLLSELGLRGVVITSRSENYDFVVRVFAPKYGINEDPVTGSVYTELTPYWSGQLGKKCLSAKQVSKRGGEVLCVDSGDRVKISGKAIKFMQGVIEINI